VTLEDDYLHATRTLREMNELAGKVTEKARHRIAAHTLREQLEAHLANLRKEFGNDQSDIDTAFAADKSWSGQHARLHPKGWDAGV
jgi:hypothetical protein